MLLNLICSRRRGFYNRPNNLKSKKSYKISIVFPLKRNLGEKSKRSYNMVGPVSLPNHAQTLIFVKVVML